MHRIRSLNINRYSLIIAITLAALVQLVLVIVFEVISFLIAEFAGQMDWVFEDCCWPYFTPTIAVITGTFYSFINGRGGRLNKRDGIVGGAITVLLSSIAGFISLMCSRWLILPQLTDRLTDYETRLEGMKSVFLDTDVIYTILVIGYVFVYWPLMKLALGGLGGLIGVGLVNRKWSRISREEGVS
jgi:hypothetical protein